MHCYREVAIEVSVCEVKCIWSLYGFQHCVFFFPIHLDTVDGSHWDVGSVGRSRCFLVPAEEELLLHKQVHSPRRFAGLLLHNHVLIPRRFAGLLLQNKCSARVVLQNFCCTTSAQPASFRRSFAAQPSPHSPLLCRTFAAQTSSQPPSFCRTFAAPQALSPRRFTELLLHNLRFALTQKIAFLILPGAGLNDVPGMLIPCLMVTPLDSDEVIVSRKSC